MINLNLGDCMESMRQTPDNFYDLAITDPPYGGNDAIGLKDCKTQSKQATKRTNYKVFKNTAPPPEYFIELKRVSKNQIVWGVNFYKDIDLSGGRLVWDKKGTAFGRAELAYLSMTKSVNICEITWNGMLQQDMKNKEKRIHPTQKPVKLYEWLLQNYAQIKCPHKHLTTERHLCTDCRNSNVKILDTHGGSMSIALACHNLGFSLDLWELDKDYYEAGTKRYNNHILQQRLFQL